MVVLKIKKIHYLIQVKPYQVNRICSKEIQEFILYGFYCYFNTKRKT